MRGQRKYNYSAMTAGNTADIEMHYRFSSSKTNNGAIPAEMTKPPTEAQKRLKGVSPLEFHRI